MTSSPKGVEVIDNFLSEDDFKPLQDLLLGSGFSWFYNKEILVDDNPSPSLCNFQFTHSFYRPKLGVQSRFFDNLAPSLRQLKVKTLIRAKANLNPFTESSFSGGFHIDTSVPSKTAILYINSNNGFTSFEDGFKVESIANRAVIFDSHIRHTGNSCTDSKIRVLLNYNFIPYQNDT
jgi:hypothetical protein